MTGTVLTAVGDLACLLVGSARSLLERIYVCIALAQAATLDE